MIRYLRHKEIDLERWDRCISSASNTLIYAASWYLNVISHHSWDALVLNDYEAVMPLPIKRKFAVPYIYPPFFAQQLGVFSAQTIDKVLMEEFINAIPSAFLYVEMVLNESCTGKIPANVRTNNQVTIKLNLNLPVEVLQHNYGYNLRRNLKKVMLDDIVLTEHADIHAIETLFRKARGEEFSNVKEEHYATLRNLVTEAKKRNHCFTMGVENKNGQLVAGAVFLVYGKRIIFIFSGQSEEGRTYKALFFLLDRVIQKYAGTDMILDFEGGNDKDLARFYKGFGGTESVYSKIVVNKLSWLFRNK